MAAISRSNLLKELLPGLNEIFRQEYESFHMDIPNATQLRLIMNNWRAGVDLWTKHDTPKRGSEDPWWGDTVDILRAEKWFSVVWAFSAATNNQNVISAAAALIAHPECVTLLEAGPYAVRLMRESGNHEAKLLYPAVCLINGVEP